MILPVKERDATLEPVSTKIIFVPDNLESKLRGTATAGPELNTTSGWKRLKTRNDSQKHRRVLRKSLIR